MKKQSKQKPRTTTTRTTRALDARRLSAVRGGLGITVEEPPPPPTQIMQQQHNERLLRL